MASTEFSQSPPVYDSVPAGPPSFSSQSDLSTAAEPRVPIPPAVSGPASRTAPSINLLFLGPPSVGKSTFISQLANVRDGKLQKPAVSRSSFKSPPNPSSFGVSLFARPYNITIYRSTSTLFVDPLPPPTEVDPVVPSISALVLCYAVDDRTSLFNVQKYWHRVFTEKYVQEFGIDVPKLLLGLKRDLRTGEKRKRPIAQGDEIRGEERGRAFEQQQGWRETLLQDQLANGQTEEEEYVCVMPDEAVRIANEMRCDRYAECSAVTGDLMFEALEDITRMAAMTTTEKGGFSDGPGCTVI